MLAVTSSGATETLRLEAESLADPTSSPSPSSDPTNPTDTNQAVTVPSDTNGAFIDLTAETITLPEGFTVEAYSINGGGKWKKGSLPASAKFTKLFNKELTLWVTDSFDTKAKSPTAEVKAVAATESARLWRPKTPPK